MLQNIQVLVEDVIYVSEGKVTMYRGGCHTSLDMCLVPELN